MIDPQRYQEIAGQPPGPSGPFDDLSSSVPLAGPALAYVLQRLEDYSNAVPRKILGSLFALPGVRDVASGGDKMLRDEILGSLRERGGAGAYETVAQKGVLSKIPFGGPIAETLADPLLGIGPVAKLGAGARSLVGGAARGIMGVPNISRGTTTIPSAIGDVPAFSARPGSDWVAQSMDKVKDWMGRALGPVAANPMLRSAFAKSQQQEIRENVVQLRELFSSLRRASPDESMTGLLTDLGKLDEAGFTNVLKNRSIPDQLIDVYRREHFNIKGAVQGAQREHQGLWRDVRDVMMTARPGLVLPEFRGAEIPVAIRRTMEEARALGINKRADLEQYASTVWANDNRLRPLRNRLQKLRDRNIDPIANLDDVPLILSEAVERQIRRGAPARNVLSGPAGIYRFVGDVQRQQALTSIPYTINNTFWNGLALSLARMPLSEVGRNRFDALITGVRSVVGKRGQLDVSRESLLPRRDMEFYQHLGLDGPPPGIDPGDIAALPNLWNSIDDLTESRKMALERTGLIYPAITMAAGFISGGLAGAPIGALTGAAVQKLAPVIRDIERVQDYFARSMVTRREMARFLNEAWEKGIPGKWVDPTNGAERNFITYVINQVDRGKHLVNPAAQNMPLPENLSNLATALTDAHGIISADDLSALIQANITGASRAFLSDIKREWASAIYSASQSGVAATKRILIIPETRNLDEHLKYLFMFHHWAARSIPWFVENMAATPQMAAILLRQMANAEKEAQTRGLPHRLDNYAAAIWPQTIFLGGLLNTILGPGTMYYNPLLGANPMATVAQYEPQENKPEQELIRFGQQLGFRPVAVVEYIGYLNGLFGEEQPSPDFFRQGEFVRSMTGTDINQPLRQALDVARISVGQTPANYEDYAVRRRIRELAQTQGLDPQARMFAWPRQTLIASSISRPRQTCAGAPVSNPQ